MRLRLQLGVRLPELPLILRVENELDHQKDQAQKS